MAKCSHRCAIFAIFIWNNIKTTVGGCRGYHLSDSNILGDQRTYEHISFVS